LNLISNAFSLILTHYKTSICQNILHKNKAAIKILYPEIQIRVFEPQTINFIKD